MNLNPKHILGIIIVIIICMIGIMVMFTVPIGIFPPEVYKEFQEPIVIVYSPTMLIVLAIFGIISLLLLNYYKEKDNEKWSEPSILKGYKNPSNADYLSKAICPEVTFIGMKGDFRQPDFAEIHIEVIPDKTIIDLKSLKFYLQDFRDKLVSYERLLNVIYDDIKKVYEPKYLKVYMKTNPRGGIYSELERSSE